MMMMAVSQTLDVVRQEDSSSGSDQLPNDQYHNDYQSSDKEDEVVDASDGVIVRCEYSSAEFSVVIIWFSPVRRISLLLSHITLPKKKPQLN